MEFKNAESETVIPTKIIGPIKFRYYDICKDFLQSADEFAVNTTSSENYQENLYVPCATFETPLWHSTMRGALVSQRTSGINAYVIEDIMTRSIILEASNLQEIFLCKKWIDDHEKEIVEIVKNSSNFAKLSNVHMENVGCLLYVRFSMQTGNASGHNMATKAADLIANFITSKCENIKYVSVSGNYCTDKKNSSVNGILGRGKHVSAEIIIPRDICEFILKTTPEKIVDLNVKKNFIGSILAGSIRSANAHFANIILAMFLATGQDSANIVEASQGVTFAEIRGDDLYFSVTIPNLIIGTVGNGKHLAFARNNMELMGCGANDPLSSRRLSAIITAAVLCAELSLMSAQTNPGELIRSHIELER